MEDKRKLKRKVLVEFMKYKDKFFTKEDEEELSKMNLKRAEKIFDKLNLHISTDMELYDAEVCPYCQDVKADDCRKCLYAKRHGKCGETGSTYSEIVERLSIVEIIGENVIKRIWNMLKVKYKLSEDTAYKSFFTIEEIREILERFTITLNTMIERYDYKAIKLLDNTSDADINLVFTKIQRNLILALDNLLVSNCDEINFKEIYPYCKLLHSVLFASCEACMYKSTCNKEDKFNIDIIIQLWESILFDVHNLCINERHKTKINY